MNILKIVNFEHVKIVKFEHIKNVNFEHYYIDCEFLHIYNTHFAQF